jgi:lysophospholipase L1-like esterase
LPKTNAKTGAQKRFLALGDSYTIGESVDATQRWPVQLAKLLAAKQSAPWRIQIIAQTGWTTDELDHAIDEQLAHINPPYDLVSLLIGVNNQYRGRSVDEYAKQFAQLLQRAIGFAGEDQKRVIVLSIPDWGQTPFALNDKRSSAQIGAEIDAFNRAARQVSAQQKVRFVDITTHSRSKDRGTIANDGLHPSAKAYRHWANIAADLLTNSRC